MLLTRGLGPRREIVGDCGNQVAPKSVAHAYRDTNVRSVQWGGDRAACLAPL